MDSASELTLLVASKLVVYTLGSVVYLFLMMLIIGQPPRRRIDWLLLALASALFMWNSGNLLAVNAGLAYGAPPRNLFVIARWISCVGLVLAAPLSVHVQMEHLGESGAFKRVGKLLVIGFWLPALALPWLMAGLAREIELDSIPALGRDARLLAIWIVAALAVVLAANVEANKAAPEQGLKRFHWGVAGAAAFLAIGVAWAYVVRWPLGNGLGGYFAALLMLAVVVPGLLVTHAVFRHHFLGFQVQRNLSYSLVAIFALVVYLKVIRRLSGYLDARGILPSEATDSVMIFLLVVLIEPVKRGVDRALRAAFAGRIEQVRRLASKIQDCAKEGGDLEALRRFVEAQITVTLGVKATALRFDDGREGTASPPVDRAHARRAIHFPVHRGEELSGELEVIPPERGLSADQRAALQLLASQLGAAIELCRLIGERVRLERALAEKSKMAFLGEMAARIAHNVKNPLSSMKTIVQLLEEDDTLPDRVREDCRLVAGEIDRLNANISQVLRYAKPARDTGRPIDLAEVVRRSVALERPRAEQQRIRLLFEGGGSACLVHGGDEATGDILSNLILNAIEASPAGSAVRVRISGDGTPRGGVELWVEDQGPGIPPEARAQIFQPFFTTRPGGTGLGLAIVEQRVAEIGGSVSCTSPVEAGRGTRFIVRFRRAE